VAKIKSLALSQAGLNAGDPPFTYITDGVVASPEIAATNCTTTADPNVVCWADMQLLVRYFGVDEPGDLIVFGSVEVSFLQ
jgi:hypothetical protein